MADTLFNFWWWFTIFVAILFGLFAHALFSQKIDNFLNGVSSWWLNLSEPRRSLYAKRVLELKNSDEKRNRINHRITHALLLSIFLLAAAITISCFIILIDSAGGFRDVGLNLIKTGAGMLCVISLFAAYHASLKAIYALRVLTDALKAIDDETNNPS